MRFLSIATIALVMGLASAEDTWKQSLSVKADALEKNIREKHNILGLYPSMVQIPPKGQAIDITTATPFSDIAHAVCWTANHLAGQSIKVAYLEEIEAPEEVTEAARDRADELFEAIYRCQRVTGVRGLQARGYFLGHGPVYEERYGSDKSDEWHQGVVNGQAFRWRGDPSHHNYSDAIHGLGQYIEHAAKGLQQARAQEAIDALVSWWVDNDLIIYDHDGQTRTVPILGFTDGKTLNTRIIMAIAGAKVAHDVTAKEKFSKVYYDLIDQYGVRGIKEFDPGKSFDDAEHVFCHLENLMRLEDDPELLAAYRVILDGLWENHKDDGQSLFTYTYYGLAPDAPGKEEALKEAHQALATWPTDMTIQPRMNSLNPDVKPPYPVYMAAWDNEYIWKGNLLRADGWLSRPVVGLAVSPEDPMVIYAVEANGSVYMSRDGGATAENWSPVDENLPSAARAVDVGAKSRIAAVAAADGFYLSTTGGAQWAKLPVPAEGDPRAVQFDRENGNVLYVTTTHGAYRSADFGEDFLGQQWESLTEGLPPMGEAQYVVAPGENGRVYVRKGASVFSRAFGENEWKRGGEIGLGEYATPYDWLAVDPADPNRILTGVQSSYGALNGNSLLQQSTDAGATWSNSMSTVYDAFAEGGASAVMKLMVRGSIGAPVYAPEAQGVVYAPSDSGVMKSADGGESWETFANGLDIPRASAVFAPENGDWIFASTPAGLFRSNNGGASWENAHLVLQFDKNTRRELGGAAYLDAYWRARYYGFIDDTTANDPEFWRQYARD